MNVLEKNIDELIPYANNPRNNDSAVDAVAASISEFGFKQPIVIDKNNVIVAGHTRLLAAKKLKLETVPVVIADDLTDAQVKAFRLADNKVGELATWDMEKLELELADLEDLDMKEFGFEDFSDGSKEGYSSTWDENGGKTGSLVENYGVPPFSVLDTRQGYWQNRKREWLELTGNLSETRDGEHGTFGEGMLKSINGGTSNFDPVLAEIMYKWFCPKGGHILDPFGGEQTKGVVAGELGYKYTAVEFRDDQVKLNNQKTEKYADVSYTCGDSNNISKLIEKRGFDMCFTSPPYYDLEVYSAEDMSALGTYEEFMKQYENIFTQCFEMLHEDSFLVIKIAEIRDKKTGEYRSFVADNIDMFRRIGFKYYNELILLNAVGTVMLRVNKSMATRKIGKIHQNVLVFYKGNLDNIPKKFEQLDFSEYDEEEQESEENPDFFNDARRLYSAFIEKKDAVEVPSVYVGIVNDVAKKIGWNMQVKGIESDFTVAPVEENKRIMIGMSGGLDSVYMMHKMQDAGFNVTAVHIKGLNKSSASIEAECAERVATDAGANFIAVDFKAPKQEFADNPFKNQLILSMMLDRGAKRGIYRYSLGSDWTTPLKEAVVGFTITDTIEVNRAYWKGVKKHFPQAELVFIDDHDKKYERLQYLFTKHRESLENLSSCIASVRFRGKWHETNEQKYGIKLMKGRCGSCYKCAMEYILLVEAGLVKKNDAFYDHSWKTLATSKTAHRPDLFSPKLSKEERLKNLKNYGS